MKKFSVFLEGDSNERQQKKKLTLALIYVTVAVIACLLVTLFVTSIVNKKPADEEGGGGASGEPAMTTVTIAPENLYSGTLILVNNVDGGHEFKFENNPASKLVSMSGTKKYTLRDKSFLANATALSAFDNMMNGLYTNVKDAKIIVTAAYRTKEEQDKLKVPGGYSDSHTGMLFALEHLNESSEGETSTTPVSSLDKYDWLYKNAHKYGFVVRYPADSTKATGVSNYDYAFRYVGVAHATYMYQNGLCLEEYLDVLQALGDGASLSINAADGKNYEVYYYKASESPLDIEIPEKVAYEISGDNEAGYIVTLPQSKAKTTNTQ